MQAACARSSRDPASVTLICVTKTIPASTIQEVLSLGVTDLGENRVQEAREKHHALAAAHPAPRWHLIGSLQRNKAAAAVELFDVIHSVDSLPLIEELERQAAKHTSGFRLQAASRRREGPVKVLIQVNISGELTKSGCKPEEAAILVRAVLQAQHLRFSGYMTIPPIAEDPEASRPFFRQLRQLRDQVAHSCSLQPVACSLSMGMSQDFEIAIEEGADLVRVGTAIFGSRT